MCYVDLLAPKSQDIMYPLKCNCPPEWTGDRCEVPINGCDLECYNDGVCYKPSPNEAPRCNCPVGFSGTLCESCSTVLCRNNGICVRNNVTGWCRCPHGYSGKSCEISECEKHCGDQVSLTLIFVKF